MSQGIQQFLKVKFTQRWIITENAAEVIVSLALHCSLTEALLFLVIPSVDFIARLVFKYHFTVSIGAFWDHS